MTVLLGEWLWLLAALCGCGAVGAAGAATFAGTGVRVALLAPLVGALCLATGMTVGWWLDLPLAANLAVNVALWLALLPLVLRATATRLGSILPGRSELALVAVVAMAATALAHVGTLHSGTQALLVREGSDTFGYTHTTDWIVAHRRSDAPAYTPERPYDSYPHHTLSRETRPGVYMLLGVAALARGRFALFAYDALGGFLLAAAALALVAACGASRGTAALLFASQLLAPWPDLLHSGYLGKLACYPALTVCVVLALRIASRPALQTAAVLVVALGVSLVYSGFLVGTVLALAGLGRGVFALWRRPAGAAARSRWLLAVPFGLAVACALSWILQGQPLVPSREQGLQWRQTMLVAWDLDLFMNGGLRATGKHLQAYLFPLAAAALVLAAIAWRLGAANALALLVTPWLLLGIGRVRGEAWPLLQLHGLFTALTLAGAGIVLVAVAEHGSRRLRVLALAAVTAVGALHVPRWLASCDRYLASSIPSACRYRLADFERIRDLVGPHLLELRTAETVPGLAAFTWLHRSGVALQFDAAAWRAVLGYRPWPAPANARAPDFLLYDAPAPDGRPAAAPAGGVEVFRCAQYVLVRAGS